MKKISILISATIAGIAFSFIISVFLPRFSLAAQRSDGAIAFQSTFELISGGNSSHFML